ncbi:hypothetical protein J0H58_33130 [bacterium]|nr:hypothetical protein [bacterium]
MDADFFAADLMITNFKRIVDNKHDLPDEAQYLFQDPRTAMFNLAVAICILARLFEDEEITGTDLARRTHPPFR